MFTGNINGTFGFSNGQNQHFKKTNIHFFANALRVGAGNLKLKKMKISDFFRPEEQELISKHSDNAYKEVDMTILDLYRFIQWIEETLWEEESKYEYNEDFKQSEMVEVIRYNQKQAMGLLRERLSKELREYFYDKELKD